MKTNNFKKRILVIMASNGNSIFLPAGGYWLNSFDTDCPSYAWSCIISSDPAVMANGIASTPRYFGLSVRPVHPYGWPFCLTDE